MENALAHLLEGEGYSTKVLKAFPLEEDLQEELPLVVGGGADVVILAPSLSTTECNAFIALRRTAKQSSTSSSSTPPTPVVVLCSPMREAPTLLEEETVRTVPWPTTCERLVREIEAALLQRARFAAPKGRVSVSVKGGYSDGTP